MAVRSFNGTSSDYLVLDNGAATANPTASTQVLLLNFAGATEDVSDPFAITSSTGEAGLIHGIRIWWGHMIQFFCKVGGSNSNSNCVTTPALGAWILLAATKPSGSGAPTGHWKNISSGTWSHAAGDTVTADSIAPTNFQIGRHSGNYFNGLVAAAAYYDYALSDTQVESLLTNLKTSDWFNVSGGGADPVAAWQLNQASTATSVTDLTGGGADQVTLSGTSVVTGSDPSGWTFDGAGVPPQKLRPDADTTTTGWSTAPLYSKINDQSDATLITATLS